MDESSTYEDELKRICACKIQACIRRYLTRRKLNRLLNERYEKIYDPKKKRYYYYDKVYDQSSWHKPLLFKDKDVEVISPTYFVDEAALMIQRIFRSHVSLRLLRILYAENVKFSVDPVTKKALYTNKITGVSSFTLPSFMNGKLDHKFKDKSRILKNYRNKDKPKVVKEKKSGDDDDEDEDDEEEEEEEEEQESDGSELSESSEAVVEKRQALRKYPRSRVQALVDDVEDNRKVKFELNLDGIGAAKFSTRIFDLTNLTKLILSHNCMRKINPFIKFLEKLKYLDVSHNLLKTLPVELEDLTQLTTFLVSYNRLASYPGNIYKMKQLQVFDISHNPLGEIPIEVGNLQLLKELQQWEVGIGMLTNLNSLTVDSIGLTAWPPQLESCTLLKSLTIANNNMNEVPLVISAHTGLTYFDGRNNHISSVPIELFMLPVKTVFLQNNQLLELPERVVSSAPAAKYTKVQKNAIEMLDLSFNAIGALNSILGLFTAVKAANFSHNQISRLSDDVGIMTNLTHLDLSYNNLVELPENIGLCKSLTELDLSHNQLVVLPVGMGSLRSLAKLNCAYNCLVEYSGKVAPMLSSLEMLDLSYNKINKLPVALFTCVKLRRLDLKFNEISALNSKLGQLIDLTYLDVSHNQLEELPEEISGTQQLAELNLSYNLLRGLPNSLCELKKLHKIFLDHNVLTESPDVLHKIPLLVAWNLAWNRIPGHFVDYRVIDKGFQPSYDLVPTGTLRRILTQAWDKLSMIMQDPTSYRPLMITKVGAVEDSLMGKEAKLAAEKRQLTNQRIRQTLADVLKWQQQLKSAFVAMEANPFDIRNSSDMPSEVHSSSSTLSADDKASLAAAEIDKIANIGLVALERRRAYLQFLNLSRKLKLRDTLQHDSERNAHMVASSVYGPDIVPDADIIETLDLGIEFQRPIDTFEQIMREISVLAIVEWTQIFVRDSNRIREIKKREQEAVLLAAAMGEHDSPSTALGHLAKSAVSHKTPVDEMLHLLNDLRGLVVSKQVIVNPTSLPIILHYPRFGPSGSTLTMFALDCYAGLATSLLMRSDKIAKAIRVVEKRAGVKASVLDIAQRFGEDYTDLMEDVCSNVISKLNAQAKAGALLSRQQKKKADTANLVRLSSDGIDLGLDMEPDIKRTATAEEEISPKKKVKAKARQRERKPPIADDEYDLSPIPLQRGRACVEFLRQVRRHILVWACKILDSTSELLFECGWGPPTMNNTKKVGQFVEEGAEQLKSRAAQVFFLKGRVYQSLEVYDRAIADLSLAREIAPAHRPAIIELIKINLAVGDYSLAYKEIIVRISRECTDVHESKYSDSATVFKSNKELGLLLMYSSTYQDYVRQLGVQSTIQRRIFDCQDNGLLRRPALSSELLFGRSLAYDKECASYRSQQRELNQRLEIVETREELEKNVGRMFSKYHQILEDAKLELEGMGF